MVTEEEDKSINTTREVRKSNIPSDEGKTHAVDFCLITMKQPNYYSELY